MPAGYQAIRHQEGLGGGDVKLLGMIGAFVGWAGVVFTILVASVVGALVGIVVMRRSGEGMKTMVPFGPFLSLGAVCYIFVGHSFYAWYLGEMFGPVRGARAGSWDGAGMHVPDHAWILRKECRNDAQMFFRPSGSVLKANWSNSTVRLRIILKTSCG